MRLRDQRRAESRLTREVMAFRRALDRNANRAIHTSPSLGEMLGHLLQIDYQLNALQRELELAGKVDRTRVLRRQADYLRQGTKRWLFALNCRWPKVSKAQLSPDWAKSARGKSKRKTRPQRRRRKVRS